MSLDRSDVHVARVLAGGQLVDAQVPMMAGWIVNLSTSIWVKTVSRCMKARETGMSKARMRSTAGQVPEDVLGHDVDRGSLGALGDADGEGPLVDVQHVAALGVELAVAAEVQRDVLVVRGGTLKTYLPYRVSRLRVTEYMRLRLTPSPTTANGSRVK